MASVNFTYMNYAGFYKDESEFRKLCERLDKFDFSSVDRKNALSPRGKELLKKHAREFHVICFPMRIYNIDEVPGLNIIYVACNGLREEQLPDIEEAHRMWLKKRIASGWDNKDGKEQQVIISAYAPGDDDSSPEQVMFLCRGINNPPAPGNDLHFSRVFHPDPPWDYDGDNAVLYEGMAYARQISATGSARFLKIHTTESIKIIMEKVNSISEYDTSAPMRKFIPELERLCREADGMGITRDRRKISDTFNRLFSAMDEVIENMLESVGLRRQSSSSSPGSMAEGHQAEARYQSEPEWVGAVLSGSYGEWSDGYKGDRAA